MNLWNIIFFFSGRRIDTVKPFTLSAAIHQAEEQADDPTDNHLDCQIAASVHRAHSGQDCAAGYEDRKTDYQANALHSCRPQKNILSDNGAVVTVIDGPWIRSGQAIRPASQNHRVAWPRQGIDCTDLPVEQIAQSRQQVQNILMAGPGMANDEQVSAHIILHSAAARSSTCFPGVLDQIHDFFSDLPTLFFVERSIFSSWDRDASEYSLFSSI